MWLIQTQLCGVCACAHSAGTPVHTCPLTHTHTFWQEAILKYNLSCVQHHCFPSILLGFGYQHPSLSCHCLTPMKALFPEYFSHREQTSEDLGWGPAWCPLLLLLTLCWLCSLLLLALLLLLWDKVTQQRMAENKVTQTHLSALRKGLRLLGTFF